MRNLRVQLLISHMILVVLLGVVMSGLVRGFFLISHRMDGVLQQNVPGLLQSQRMQQSIERQEVGMNLLINMDLAAARAEFEDSWQTFRRTETEAESLASGDQRALLQQIAIHAGRYESKVRQTLYSAPPTTQAESEDRYTTQIRPLLLRLSERVNELSAVHVGDIGSASGQIRSRVQMAAGWSLGVVAGTLILAILLSYLVVRFALSPLRRLTEQVTLIGQGDFSHRLNVRRTDEIGGLADAFNLMVDKLDQLRQKEQRKLQRAEQMADVALANLYDPVVVTDAKGRIVFLNRAAEGLWGPSPIAPRAPIIEHVSDQRIIRAIAKAIEEREVTSGEDEDSLIPIRVGDHHRTYRLRASPMMDSESKLLGSVTVLEDITHLKQVDQMKGEFIGVASHELKTPVQSLLLSAQLLKEGAAGPLTPKQEEVVSAQLDDLERLDRLTRELLDITRLEAGSAPPRFQLIDASDLVNQTYKSLRGKAEAKGVHLSAIIPEQKRIVKADPSQLGRVMINLADNAIRHTSSGGSVLIQAKELPNHVTFCVQDTGEGIPKEYLAKIFDRFVQVPGATQGGAGLGLSIAGTILKAHGSELRVRSELGKGSCFEFDLDIQQTKSEGTSI